MKACSKCGIEKPLTEFYSNGKNGLHTQCKNCDSTANVKYQKNHRKKISDYNRNRRHERGISKPFYENKREALFLGVHIAERALSNVFKNVRRMPINNPGYDFICGKGYKVDVKSSCYRFNFRNKKSWKFDIKKNKIPDYFALLAFDNRDDLTPVHFWLIPGDAINKKFNASIAPSTVSKWAAYEQPIDRVMCGCNLIRSNPDIDLLPASIGVEAT